MKFKIYVRALIVEPQGNILLVKKHSDQKIAAGKWLLPGGSVEFGETPTEALTRELKEEVNFRIESAILIGTETMIIDDTHWLGLYYRAAGDSTTALNLETNKHEKIEWHSVHFTKTIVSSDIAQILDLA